MARMREELPQDSPAVRGLLVEAFGGEIEARLVERLRAAGKSRLALVAEDEDRVLGYVLFSPILVGDDRPALALAPVAVLPAFQRLGIGSALVSAGLQRLREGDDARVLVLGDPAFYTRFGFVPAAGFGLRCPFPAPEEAFMALELQPGAFSGCEGPVRYGHEFDDLE